MNRERMLMSTKLFIAKCTHLSMLLNEAYNKREEITIVNYCARVLKGLKEFINPFDGDDKELEMLNDYYQITFFNFMKFQEER